MKKTPALIDDQTAEAMRQLLEVAEIALNYLKLEGYRREYLQGSVIVRTAEERLRTAARRRP
jgi:hypothetical protein